MGRENIYTNVQNQRLVVGYDGPLDYYFIEVYDTSDPEEPIWDSTFSVDYDPFKAHKTPEETIAAAEAAGYVYSDTVKTAIDAAMRHDRSAYVDQRSPAMKAFQANLRNWLPQDDNQ